MLQTTSIQKMITNLDENQKQLNIALRKETSISHKIYYNTIDFFKKISGIKIFKPSIAEVFNGYINSINVLESGLSREINLSQLKLDNLSRKINSITSRTFESNERSLTERLNSLENNIYYKNSGLSSINNDVTLMLEEYKEINTLIREKFDVESKLRINQDKKFMLPQIASYLQNLEVLFRTSINNAVRLKEITSEIQEIAVNARDVYVSLGNINTNSRQLVSVLDSLNLYNSRLHQSLNEGISEISYVLNNNSPQSYFSKTTGMGRI